MIDLISFQKMDVFAISAFDIHDFFAVMGLLLFYFIFSDLKSRKVFLWGIELKIGKDYLSSLGFIVFLCIKIFFALFSLFYLIRKFI